MSSNKLKSNKGKMKVMFFGKTSDLKKLNITSICIGDFRIIPSLVATNFGVDLDLGLKMEKTSQQNGVKWLVSSLQHLESKKIFHRRGHRSTCPCLCDV